MNVLVRILIAGGLSAGMIACSSSDKPEPEGGVAPADRTHVVFNPAFSQMPTPNDILFASDPNKDGTMFAGEDPANPVIAGIDALDGNSLMAPFDISFTGSLSAKQVLDAASFIEVDGAVIPNPTQNVFLLPLRYASGDGLLQASADIDGDGSAESIEVPTFYEALAYQRAIASKDPAALAKLVMPKVRVELISLDGGSDNVIRINPLQPLMPKTKYLVVITGLIDAKNNPVFASDSYSALRDPNGNVGIVNPALAPLATTVKGWEALASGYFGFKQAVFDQANAGISAPKPEDILLSMSFTTTASTDILNSIAAPESFFEDSLRAKYKKDAIVKLVTGVYTLDGPADGLSATDTAINTSLIFLLTSATLPDMSVNPLYSEDIANAIAAGADYKTIASGSASAAFIMQTASAQSAIQVHDSAVPDIATTAIGTVIALAGNDLAAVADVFPIPAARKSTFFRKDKASDINPALQAPAIVYQGEITLPQYQVSPTEQTASVLKTSSWQADEALGARIDAGSGNDQGTTPPSSKVTYRYPFPAKQDDVTVPIVAMLPDNTTLTAIDPVLAKPAEGWPVVISIHGISSDRSAVLPMANAMAFACVSQTQPPVPSGAPCFATIAIDQPLHGATPSGTTVAGLYNASHPDASITPNIPMEGAGANQPSAELTERHFNYTADATLQPIKMDYANNIGSSGSLFINLTNFTNGRDRLRQMVIDLLNLNASLPELDIDGVDNGPDIDLSRIYVIGHSLGAIDSIPFVAINNSDSVQGSILNKGHQIKAAAFLNTSGSMPKLLVNSPSFAPTILQALASASDSLKQGQSGLEAYFNVFQGLLDSVDPMGFAPMINQSSDPAGVILTEMIGSGTPEKPKDQTIPNAADTIWGDDNGPLMMDLGDGFVIGGFPAPLAGTEPLISQFGAVKTADANAEQSPAVVVTRFIEGSHGNNVSGGNPAIDPIGSPAVFVEMVSEFVNFFARDGKLTEGIVANPDVVEK